MDATELAAVFPKEPNLDESRERLDEACKRTGKDAPTPAIQEICRSKDVNDKSLGRQLYLSMGGVIPKWMTLERPDGQIQALTAQVQKLFGEEAKEEQPAKQPAKKQPADKADKPKRAKAKKPAEDNAQIQELQQALKKQGEALEELQAFVTDIHAMMQLYFISNEHSGSVLNDGDSLQLVYGKLLKDTPIIEGNG